MSAEAFLPREFHALGQRLPYRLLLPRRLDPAQSYPLVLFLHGAGERGDDNIRQLSHVVQVFAGEAVARRHPAFVVAPQCPEGARWVEKRWDGDDPYPAELSAPLRLALTLLSSLQVEYHVDPDCLYVMGLSMGGFGAWEAVLRYPRLFAAAVPICGGGDVRRARTLAGMPIWAFHGARDDVVPPRCSREMIAALQAAGGHPRYTEYPDAGHDCWTRAIAEPDLLPWLFGQRRSL